MLHQTLENKKVFLRFVVNYIITSYFSFNSIFSDRRTLKFLQVKCNPTNKKSRLNDKNNLRLTINSIICCQNTSDSLNRTLKCTPLF